MTTDRVATLDAVASILDAQGIDIDEFVDHVSARDAGTTRPRVAEYVKEFLARLKPNTRRTWRTHLERICCGAPPLCSCLCEACTDVVAGCTCSCSGCEDQRIAIPAAAEMPVSATTFSRSLIETVVEYAARHAAKVARIRNRRRAAGLALHVESGSGAAGIARDAVSSLLTRAVGDGFLAINSSQAVRVKRSKARERSLTSAQLAEVVATAGSGGNDPELDSLLIWFHIETGARRAGAIGLRVGALIASTGQIRLREKGETDERQPATADLIATLQAHAIQRGGEKCDPASALYDPAAPVMYYRPHRNGEPHPLTDRRYDTLFARMQRSLEWAGATKFTAHGLRYTGAAAIEREGGTAVARRFLRHAERSDTDRYTASSEAELIAAFEAVTGERHPLGSG